MSTPSCLWWQGRGLSRWLTACAAIVSPTAPLRTCNASSGDSRGQVQKKLGGVHGQLRGNAQGFKVFQGIAGVPGVQRVAFREQDQLVEHVEHAARWLVDGGHDHPAGLFRRGKSNPTLEFTAR